MQRRTLAACIFALAFILFYEARGQRMISFERETPIASQNSALTHYWEQTTAGIFVLAIGAVLIVALRRHGQPLNIPRPELVVYGLAVGVLLGTAVVSWSVANNGARAACPPATDGFYGARAARPPATD